MTPGLRRLYVPQRVSVKTHGDGSPRAVEGIAVESVREHWRVEDRWWTPRPLRRAYFELVLADGRVATVFRAGASSRWYRQRA